MTYIRLLLSGYSPSWTSIGCSRLSDTAESCKKLKTTCQNPKFSSSGMLSQCACAYKELWGEVIFNRAKWNISTNKSTNFTKTDRSHLQATYVHKNIWMFESKKIKTNIIISVFYSHARLYFKSRLSWKWKHKMVKRCKYSNINLSFHRWWSGTSIGVRFISTLIFLLFRADVTCWMMTSYYCFDGWWCQSVRCA